LSRLVNSSGARIVQQPGYQNLDGCLQKISIKLLPYLDAMRAQWVRHCHSQWVPTD